jgi:(S)-2-hydroxy-acid oxidase
LKKETILPVIVKGIMNPEDALAAIDNGADAIWVSNNGGRILDTCPSTISILKSISTAVRNLKDPKKSQTEIYLDGGIRRGTEVLKALAYGARAVFIGRPAIWGLARNGKEGVKEVIDILNEELKLSMVLTHCENIE